MMIVERWGDLLVTGDPERDKTNTIRRKVMAIVKKEQYTEPRVLDLGGPDGNAYVLLGIAHGLLTHMDRDPDIAVFQHVAFKCHAGP